MDSRLQFFSAGAMDPNSEGEGGLATLFFHGRFLSVRVYFETFAS